MARVFRSLLVILTMLCALALPHPLSAQTYNPKAIHFEGSLGLDATALLHLSGLRGTRLILELSS